MHLEKATRYGRSPSFSCSPPLHYYPHPSHLFGPLSDEVELFGMSLLGQMTVSGFGDRLEKSVKTASLYLDVRPSTHLFSMSSHYCLYRVELDLVECVYLCVCVSIFLGRWSHSPPSSIFDASLHES